MTRFPWKSVVVVVAAFGIGAGAYFALGASPEKVVPRPLVDPEWKPVQARVQDLAQADDLHALRREVAELRALIEQRGLPRRRPLLLFLVIGELIIIALLLYFGIHS